MMNRRFFTLITLLLCSIIYNLYLLKIPLNLYDEGIILTGADRVLKGQLPYVDFWSMYPPGQYFTLAFLFKLFGRSILTERLYDIAVRSLLTTSSYVIIRKIGLSNPIALIGWGIAQIYLGDFGFPVYPVYIAILLIIFGIYFVIHHIETNQTRHLFYAGVFITISSLFRHDLAGIAASCLILTLFIRTSFEKKGCLHSVAFLFGIFVAGLPISIYLANTIGLRLLVEQLITAPAEIMPKYRWLPYPTSFSIETFQFYGYPLILLIGLISSLFIIARLKIRNTLSYGMFLLSTVGILFLNQVRVRSDSIHLLPAVLFSTIVGLSLFHVLHNSATIKIKAQFKWVGSCLLSVMIVVSLIKPIANKLNSINSNYFTLVENSRQSGYANIETDLLDLLFYLENNTHKNDAIYVGVENHDHFLVNDVIIYFLADRPYATKYHELHPGVANTLKIQNDIIKEIENASIRVAVLVPRYWDEPNETRVDSKIECLDNYIRQHYVLTRRFGIYQVWTYN